MGWPTSTCESQPPIPSKFEEAVIIDVRHHHANLVDVTRKHHA
jgi:hypothetical protein